MKSNQDSKQSRMDLNSFSLKDLKQPMPPRKRPKLTMLPVFGMWTAIVLLGLALVGGVYGCCHYFINYSRSTYRVHLHRHSKSIQHQDIHSLAHHSQHPMSNSQTKHVRPRLKSPAQMKQQLSRNEKALGGELSRTHIDPKISNQVLRSYERHSPQIQLQFYRQVTRICKNRNRPSSCGYRLQRLCKKVNKI